MWQIRAQPGELIRSHHRKREVADVGVEFVDVAANAAVNIRQKQILFAFAPIQLACDFKLAIPRLASAAQNQSVFSLKNFWFDNHHAV